MAAHWSMLICSTDDQFALCENIKSIYLYFFVVVVAVALFASIFGRRAVVCQWVRVSMNKMFSSRRFTIFHRNVSVSEIGEWAKQIAFKWYSIFRCFFLLFDLVFVMLQLRNADISCEASRRKKHWMNDSEVRPHATPCNIVAIIYNIAFV